MRYYFIKYPGMDMDVRDTWTLFLEKCSEQDFLKVVFQTATKKGIPIFVPDKEYFFPPTILESNRANRSEIDAFILETAKDVGVEIRSKMFKCIYDGIYSSYRLVSLEKQMEDREVGKHGNRWSVVH